MSEKENEKVYWEDDLNEADRFLFDLTYEAARKSNNQQFSGIAPFLYDIQETQSHILKELDDIKVLLKLLAKDNN